MPLPLRLGRLAGFAIAAAVVAAGCCGLLGGSRNHHCWAAVEYGGARQSSAGTNADADKAKASAQQGMCMGWCEYADPKVDDALTAYRKSAKGKGSRAGRGFDIDQDPKAKKLYDRCLADCAAAVQAGKAKSKFECRGPTSKTCTAELDYQGKKQTSKAAAGEGELVAWRIACREHCKKNDPAVAKAYDEWTRSPQGKKYKTPRAKALESERPSEAVNACMGRCVADILFGTASVSVTCK